MKCITYLVLLVLLVCSSCSRGVSEKAIQTAIYQTQAAKPTDTISPPPTTTNTPIPPTATDTPLPPTPSRTSTAIVSPTVTLTPTEIGGGSGRLVFYSFNNPDVYTLNLNDLSVNRLTFSEYSEYNTSWSPDGSLIAYDAGAYDLEAGARRSIFIISADGSGQTQLTTNTYSDFPVWSPDGTRLLFCSEGVNVINIDGTNQHQLTSSGCEMEWSPDGNRIVYSQYGLGYLNKNIYVMNADGSGQTVIASNEKGIGNPAWSPDGSKIAYVVSGTEADTRYEIHVVNPDGTNDTLLARGFSISNKPVWFPNSKSLLINSDIANLRSNIYMVNVDGTKSINLTNNNEMDGPPSLSPDGKLIAYSATDDPFSMTCTIRIMDVETAVILLDIDICGQSIDWSP